MKTNTKWLLSAVLLLAVSAAIGPVVYRLRDLSDVRLANPPTTGEALTWNGTRWTNGAASGGAAVTPGFTISSGFITANQTNIDNGVAGTNAFIIIGGSGNSVTNGANLLAAYTWAKASTPAGAALAAGNHFTIFLLPGTYDLGSGTLTMDTQYIDVVGVSRNTGQQRYVSSWTELGDTIITSSGNTLSIGVGGATDLMIVNVCLQTTGTSAFAFTMSNDLGIDFKMVNVLIRASASTPTKQPMRFTTYNYNGYFEDVRSWYDNSFCGTDGARTIAGLLVRCKGGPDSFGYDSSATFIECEADGCSFGRNTFSGVGIRCRAVTVNGTGCGLFADFGTMSGSLFDCETLLFGATMGAGSGGITGTMVNCAATGFGAIATTATVVNSYNGTYTVNSSRIKTQSAIGTPATTVVAGGTLKVNTTTTGNVGAGEDNLITFSVPAGQLSINGDYLEFDCFGTFAANANTKNLKVYFGSTVIFTSTALIYNGIDWRAHGKVIRTSATAQKTTTEFTIAGTLLGATTTTSTTSTTAAETLANAITFKVTGEDSGGVPVNDSVVQHGMVMKWYPTN